MKTFQSPSGRVYECMTEFFGETIRYSFLSDGREKYVLYSDETVKTFCERGRSVTFPSDVRTEDILRDLLA